MNIGPGCEGCKLLLREDHGYSNATTTGTYISCLKGVNPLITPEMEDDYIDVESSPFHAALKFGETCTSRIPGEGPWFDVDGEVREDAYKHDPDIFQYLAADYVRRRLDES